MKNKVRPIIIVGAGLSGLVLAERLANVAKRKVLILEKRKHLGGNCYDFYSDKGILVSKYGPHTFHTNEKRVYDYVRRFAKWENYKYKVSSMVEGNLVPIPVNIKTINILFGSKIKNGEEMRHWLDERRDKSIKKIRNSEEEVLSKLGRDLYEKMFKSYTKKQWGLWPKELDKEVLARIPVNYNFSEYYRDDKYQIRPINGYSDWMEKMIKNPLIELKLNTDYFKVFDELPKDALVFFSGPIDKYVSFRSKKKYKLAYRSAKFVFESYRKENFLPVGVINYPSLKTKELRSTEYKFLTGQKSEWTTISKEYFCGRGEELYPIRNFENREKLKEMMKKAKEWKEVYLIGRLGRYEYINMDQAISKSLDLFQKLSDEKKI